VVGSPIPVGQTSIGIAFDAANSNLYVVNRDSDTVSVISGQTNTVIRTIPVGNFPVGIAFDSANGNLYVVNSGDGTVSVISTVGLKPPNTIITSAIDGNGASIQNGGTTLSISIRFTFTGIQGSSPIAGFECRMDGSLFSSCSSPTILNNLAPGIRHNFQVRAIEIQPRLRLRAGNTEAFSSCQLHTGE
jgi:YVTN family beta-propeller protein